MSGTSSGSGPKTKLSRRKFLLGSAATAASAAVTVNSESANAFFNTFGFMKKFAGGGQTSNGYAIGQSLRFIPGNSAYLSRTPSSAPTSRQKFTYSTWLKRGAMGATYALLSGSDGSYEEILAFSMNASVDTLIFEVDGGGGPSFVSYTSALYRDPSAWYHIVLSVDTTQATVANRCRLYVNGIINTDSSWTNNIPVAQNFSFRYINVNGYSTQIGQRVYNNGNRFDGYLAETYMIDGQALDASYFGQSDTNSGQWIPKSYNGSYGTNGFYLKFADNSNTTAATLGKDSSGNANHFTPSGFNTYDQVLDSPTNNFATLNPLKIESNPMTLSKGNLAIAPTTTSLWGWSLATMPVPDTGKWAWRVKLTGSSNNVSIGLMDDARAIGQGTDNFIGYWGQGDHSVYKNQDGVSTTCSSALPSFGVTDSVEMRVDRGANTIEWWINGALTYSYTGIPPKANFPFVRNYSTAASVEVDFGQNGYTPPAGFKALCSANLPVPTIKNPRQYFDVSLRTGTGVTTSVTGKLFQPDLVWLKGRSNAQGHYLLDSVRGIDKWLGSQSTAAELYQPNGVACVPSLNPDGYTVGTDGGINTNTYTYVDWFWKKGATPGFDIVSYSGNNGAAMSVAHGLGTAPAFILIKDRDYDYDWIVYHRALGATKDLRLNLTNASDTNDYWDNTAPTASVFRVGTNPNVNYSTQRYIAYLWAEVPGFSKFGSYTGNGSDDGSFVYCGFKPRWVMVKRSDGAADWLIYDTARGSYNLVANQLAANTAAADAAPISNTLDILSNGFKLRSAYSSTNGNGNIFIYAAFAEAPFKYATAR